MKVPPVAIDHNPRHGKTPYLWTHPRNQDLVKLIPDTPYYLKVATIIRYKPEHKDSIIDCIGNAIKVSKQVIVVTNTQLPPVHGNFSVVDGKTHNMGQSAVHPEISWVLFLDGDEIIQVEDFRAFLNDPDTLDHSMYRFDESPSVLIRKEFANMNPSVAQVYDVRYQLHCCEYCSTFKSKRGYLTNVKWDDRFLIIKGGDEW